MHTVLSARASEVAPSGHQLQTTCSEPAGRLYPTITSRLVSLKGYDIALSMDDEELEVHGEIRFLLLSREDFNENQPTNRLEKLCSFRAEGIRVAVVFLLERQVAQSHGESQPAQTEHNIAQQRKGEDSMTLFMKLQAELTNNNTNIPLLPVATLDKLLPQLLAFRSSYAKKLEEGPLHISTIAPRDLLPYCSDGAFGSLSASAVSELSDNFYTFREILEQLSREEGREKLGRDLGDDETKKLIGFWCK